MAIKDFNSVEDQHGINKANEKMNGEEKEPSAKNEQLKTATEIKNAHASGDGSFGRSESSLPDNENDQTKDGNATY